MAEQTNPAPVDFTQATLVLGELRTAINNRIQKETDLLNEISAKFKATVDALKTDADQAASKGQNDIQTFLGPHIASLKDAIAQLENFTAQRELGNAIGNSTSDTTTSAAEDTSDELAAPRAAEDTSTIGGRKQSRKRRKRGGWKTRRK